MSRIADKTLAWIADNKLAWIAGFSACVVIYFALDIMDIARLARIRLDLPAQVFEMRVDGPGVSNISHVINHVHELRPAERAARILGQGRQQVEFGGGERYRLAANGEAAFSQVNRQIISADDARG